MQAHPTGVGGRVDMSPITAEGRRKGQPELAAVPLPLEAKIASLSCLSDETRPRS
jgi:hypothetical protein